MENWEGAQLNEAKTILAYELTKLIHGEEEANRAREAAQALFAGGANANMPSTALPAAKFDNGKIGVLSLLVACGLCASNGEARRLVQQGGVSVNDVKITAADASFDQSDFEGEGVIIKKGKKVFHKATLAQ